MVTQVSLQFILISYYLFLKGQSALVKYKFKKQGKQERLDRDAAFTLLHYLLSCV